MNLPFDAISISSPITWIVVIILVVGFLLRRARFGMGKNQRQDDEIQVFVFDADDNYDEKVGRSISSNVSYGSGAFLKRDSCVMKFFHGRPRRRVKELASRKVMPVYLTFFGGASPLDPDETDWMPKRIERDAYDNFKSIAVEHEYSRGRMESQKPQMDKAIILSVTVASAALGVIGWLLVLILPLTPLVDKP